MSTLLIPEDELLKIPELCKNILHISRSAFYKDDEFRALIIKIGRASFVSKLDIQAVLAAKRKK
jgi:hypothetical protein